MPSVCGSCDGKMMIGGPIWNGKIHDIDFVRAMHETCEKEETKTKFGTVERIKGILGGIIDEEWVAHKPLSFDLQQMCSNLKMTNPTKNQLIAAFRSLDFMSSQTYYNPTLWKTNAPPEAIYDILKSFKKEQCEREGNDYFKNVSPQSSFHTILSKPVKYQPNFNFDQVM